MAMPAKIKQHDSGTKAISFGQLFSAAQGQTNKKKENYDQNKSGT